VEWEENSVEKDQKEESLNHKIHLNNHLKNNSNQNLKVIPIKNQNTQNQKKNINMNQRKNTDQQLKRKNQKEMKNIKRETLMQLWFFTIKQLNLILMKYYITLTKQLAIWKRKIVKKLWKSVMKLKNYANHKNHIIHKKLPKFGLKKALYMQN